MSSNTTNDDKEHVETLDNTISITNIQTTDESASLPNDSFGVTATIFLILFMLSFSFIYFIIVYYKKYKRKLKRASASMCI